jgi:hypothetical protein
MKIVYFCFGRGSGYLVRAASLFFALKRAKVACEFAAVTNCDIHHVVRPFFTHHFLQPEPDKLFIRDRDTDLYHTLEQLNPDLIIVDGVWVLFFPILNDFTFKQILLIRHVPKKWLSVPLPNGQVIEINPGDYDLAFNVEPNFYIPGFLDVNPLIVKNHDEIYTREKALHLLEVPEGKKLCVIAHNGFKGEFEKLLKKTKDVPSDYHIYITTNRNEKGLFPLADYANAIDLLIGGVGYSLFYESIYFNIPAQFKIFPRDREDVRWRLKTNSNYTFIENGADQIVQKITEVL